MNVLICSILLLLSVIVLVEATTDERRGSYCIPPPDNGNESSQQCRRQHPAEALWSMSAYKRFSSAVCHDDVETDIVSTVYENTLRWLSLNATVFEAPSILETLMHRNISNQRSDYERLASDASHVDAVVGNGSGIEAQASLESSEDIFDSVDWKRMHKLDTIFKASRVMMSLHVTSAQSCEHVKRRLQQVHLQALHDFDRAVSRDARADKPTPHSALHKAVEHFFPSGVPAFERHWPLQMSLPTFVVYQYSRQHCKTCAQGLAAFHRLVDTFSYLCTKDQRAVASCSPVTYFIAYPVDTFLSVVPQVSLTKHTVIHTNPSSGERKESRRAQRVTDTMSPFSYYLEHTSLMTDYLSFLVVNEVLQLRFLSPEEATELRKKLHDIKAKRAEVEQRVAATKALEAPKSIDGADDESDNDKPPKHISGDSVESNKELQRLKDAEHRTGKVRSIQELLVLVIRAMEAGIDEGDDATASELAAELSPYVKWYAFPAPWAKERYDSDDSSEATGLLGSRVTYLCDILSCSWIAMIVWVAVHSARRRHRMSAKDE